MQAIINPSTVSGVINAPASKSSMQRALAAALLHEGDTVLQNPGNSNDDLAAIEVIKNLGAKITTENLGGAIQIKISSTGVPEGKGMVDCGESGLGIRLFTPIAAICPAIIQMTGTGSLLNRPMDFFDEIFPQLGVTVKTNQGKLPISIQGPLQPASITIDGSLSSQFLTGLLFAFAKSCRKPVTLTVTNLKSKPYIDLSLQVLRHFGYLVVNHQYQHFSIQPAESIKGATIQYTVEGDWSGGAFLLVAGAIAGEVVVRGLDIFSTQADKSILQALMMTGARVSVSDDQVLIGSPSPGSLKPFHFNATDCPDLFPPLVALAAYCNGKTVIEGVSRLAHKESNRAISLQEEFSKMGISIALQDDLMIIHGGTGLNGAVIDSHHDHRIAMATAVAGLKANGSITINGAEAINKSYPGFYEHLKLLNAAVSLIN